MDAIACNTGLSVSIAILVAAIGGAFVPTKARAQDSSELPTVALRQSRFPEVITCDELGKNEPFELATNSQEPVEDRTDENKTDHAGEVESNEQDEPEDSEVPDEQVSATLFGESLHRAGPITAEFIYTGQTYNNARGGISTKNATRYRGNLDLMLSADTNQANWWTGGNFFVYMQQSHGRTLSQDFVGDAQFYSNIDTTPKPADLTQLGEYWYQHSYGEDLLSIKLGRQDPNIDFAFADLGGDFLNSSFLTLPNIPLPTWPTQTLGVSSLCQAAQHLRLGGGAYDQGSDIGQWWATTLNRGMFFIGQADFEPLAHIEGSLLTLVRLGSWYTTSDTAASDGNSVFENNYGFYTTVDRMLYAEREEDEQGLGAFFQISWAPPDRNQLDWNYGAGLVYRGLLPGRDLDTLGCGFTLVEFSPAVYVSTGQTAENAIELFYKAPVRDWLTIQPDLQYIVRPSGIEADALVVGLGFESVF